MENLEEKLKAAVLAAAVVEERKKSERKFHAAMKWAAPAFACAALAAMLIIPSRPKDTFSDPAAAYAELEKTFAYISQKIDKGAEIASVADAPIETIKNIFE